MADKPWAGRRLLLLSGPMGTGHVQASKALAKTAELHYPELEVTHLNVAEVMTPGLRLFFTDIYHFILRRLPWLWYYMYRSSNVPPRNIPLFRKVMFRWRRKFEARLLEWIRNHNPDYIICTHFLPAEIIGKEKVAGRMDYMTASVVTDFSLHWVYIQPKLELFFVANHDMSLLMHLRGVPREKIYITGCPIFPDFTRKYTPEEKAALRRELGLPPENNFVMVMMGGENIGRLEDISRTVLEAFPGVSVLAMTGNSRKVYQRMLDLQPKYPGRLFPVGYTTRMNDYMAISYLVISKPGGITISECLAMKMPVIVMDPILGHEVKNANYLATHGLAAFSETMADLEIMDMEPGATWMQMISSNQENYRYHNAAGKILKVVVEWEGNNAEYCN